MLYAQEEVSRYASEIRELRDQNMEYEEYFAQVRRLKCSRYC